MSLNSDSNTEDCQGEITLTNRDMSKICSHLPHLLSNAHYSVYDPFNPHPAFSFITERLSLELRGFGGNFPFAKVAALTDLKPSLLSYDDIALVVRGIWKSDRVGFYRGFDELLRSGYATELLLALDDPAPCDANVPVYPEPNDYTEDTYFRSLWDGFQGLYENHVFPEDYDN